MTPQKLKFCEFGGLNPPLGQKIKFGVGFGHFPAHAANSELRTDCQNRKIAKTDPKPDFLTLGMGSNPNFAKISTFEGVKVVSKIFFLGG